MKFPKIPTVRNFTNVNVKVDFMMTVIIKYANNALKHVQLVKAIFQMTVLAATPPKIE